MKIEEVAWLAALIDGEGYVSKTYPHRMYVVNNHRGLLQRAINITRCGKLYLHSKNSKGNRAWRWVVYRKAELYYLFSLLHRFLIVKKEVAKKALARMKCRI